LKRFKELNSLDVVTCWFLEPPFNLVGRVSASQPPSTGAHFLLVSVDCEQFSDVLKTLFFTST